MNSTPAQTSAFPVSGDVTLPDTSIRRRANSLPSSVSHDTTAARGRSISFSGTSAPVNTKAATTTNTTAAVAFPTLQRMTVTADDSPPLANHQIKPEKINAFKSAALDSAKKTDEEIAAFKKNETNIKIKKVVYGLLIAIGIAAIITMCVFCPPAGIAVAAFTTGVVLAVAGYKFGQSFGESAAIPKDQLAEMEKKAKSLETTLQLFEDYKVKTPPDGSSFEEFLSTCPAGYDKALKAPAYQLDHLDKYVALFHKKRECKEAEDDVTAQKSVIEGLEREIDELSTIGQDVTEQTKKLDEANEKLEMLTRHSQYLDKEFNAEMADLKTTVETPSTAKNQNAAPILPQITDMRFTNWRNQAIPSTEKVTTIVPGSAHIYTFGTEIKQPLFGVHRPKDPDPTKRYKGENLSRVNLTPLGRKEENNFLSNAYTGEKLSIEGRSYNSVTHYMILLKLENMDTKGWTETAIKDLAKLKETVKNARSAEEAILAVKQSRMLPIKTTSSDIGEDLFTGMDTELKTALYYKFVKADGTPTAAGKKLMATKGELYAGHEPGDFSYGVEFIDGTQVIGHNKLGIALMEMRDILINNPLSSVQTPPGGLPPAPATTTVRFDDEDDDDTMSVNSGDFESALTDLPEHDLESDTIQPFLEDLDIDPDSS